MDVKAYTYYYFIGIGGIGMSALARYFQFLGKKVCGYDKTSSQLTQKLENEGVAVHYEDWENIPEKFTPENTLVIYTPAVPKSLGEYQYFEQNGFTIQKRSKVLGELTHNSVCVAIAGTHGKTTTSSMVGHLLHESKLSSTAFLGGITENYQSNVILGGEEITVVEADEFDKSFLNLSPNYACITSMDADHLDIYGKHEQLVESFTEFAQLASDKLFVKKGLAFENAITYAVEEEADYIAQNLKIENGKWHFDLKTPKGVLTHFQLSLPGKHNVENATAALAIGLEIGVSENNLKIGLKSFEGIRRRFTTYVSASGKILIDDYAHHPTELNAAIDATQTFYPNKKIVGVFQPHLYSRTRDFGEEFAKSLNVLDEIILLDIYPAREEPISGITSEWLSKKIQNPNKKVIALNNALDMIIKSNANVILLMGAGNIDTLFNPLKLALDEN